MGRHRRGVVWSLALVAAAAILGGLTLLAASGIVWPNRVFAARYEVRGADVSHHQGLIDWAALAQDDVDFVYIKSTEGSTHVDEAFQDNWDGARSQGLVTGAYHFFSFDSSGAAQARNVIRTVPMAPGMLPPVVDVEAYGRYHDELPDAHSAQPILDDLLARLENHFGRPAIIYTTTSVYEALIRDNYPDNPIWIRSVLTPAPSLADGREWTFWQYSNRDHRSGIATYVDMNVFSGNQRQFDKLRLP